MSRNIGFQSEEETNNGYREIWAKIKDKIIPKSCLSISALIYNTLFNLTIFQQGFLYLYTIHLDDFYQIFENSTRV